MHFAPGGVYLRSLAIYMAALFLISCEEPFEPLAATDLVFSIYGHLDASADTQWVRVMPLRESLLTTSGPIDAVVTLEELETGTVVEMSDSLSRYTVFLADGRFYAHNFSTTMPMVPGRHYRLTATRSDGAAASVTVAIPTFQSPTLVVRHASGLLPYGTIGDTRHLGMVLGRSDIPTACGLSYAIHQEYLPVVEPAGFEGEDHRVQLAWPSDGPRPPFVQRPPPGCPLGRKRILVVATSGPWPFDSFAELREVTHPAAIDNIEGRGLGFVAGVQSHEFPYAACLPLDGANACTITFSPQSATLVGRVTNSCTGGPLDDVQVEVLGPSAGGIRSDTTDASGLFQFEGVDPGVPYSLTLSQLLAPVDFLPAQLENIVLAEASVDTVAIEMTHRRDCLA